MGKVDQGVAVLWMAAHFWKKPLRTYARFDAAGKCRDISILYDLCLLLRANTSV